MTVSSHKTAGNSHDHHDRAILLAALNRLIDHIAAHGADGFPDPLTIQLPVPVGLGHQGKHDWLEQIAAAWETPILPDGMGGQYAAKEFGPGGRVRLVASVACPDQSVSGHKERAAAHGIRPSNAGNEATA